MEADQRDQMVTLFQHYDAYAKATMAVPMKHRATRCGVASLLVVVLRAPLFFPKACMHQVHGRGALLPMLK